MVHCAKCATAFDSLEQLGQRAAATALLFNPMGEALEIRMGLVSGLVAFHGTMSMGMRRRLQGSPREEGWQISRFQIVILTEIQRAPRTGEWRPHSSPFCSCQGRKAQASRGADLNTSFPNILHRVVQNIWREIWKSSPFVAFPRSSFSC